jgi:hypothetical protein
VSNVFQPADVIFNSFCYIVLIYFRWTKFTFRIKLRGERTWNIRVFARNLSFDPLLRAQEKRLLWNNFVCFIISKFDILLLP